MQADMDIFGLLSTIMYTQSESKSLARRTYLLLSMQRVGV